MTGGKEETLGNLTACGRQSHVCLDRVISRERGRESTVGHKSESFCEPEKDNDLRYARI